MKSPEYYVFWLESAPSGQLLPICWKTNKRSCLCLLNISETNDQSSLQVAAQLYSVYTFCLSKACQSHANQIKILYTWKAIYAVQQTKPFWPRKSNAAWVTSLDFAKSTCQLSLAKVDCEGRESKISVRLAFRHMT